MDVQSAFVDKNLTTSIKCPICGNIKSFDVRKFKGRTHNIKVKCSCETVFPVSIDFRKSIRKDVKLPGYYAKLPHQGAWSNMNVVNLSIAGLAINPIGGHNLEAGQKLKIKFILDDAEGSFIEKNVGVVNIKDSQIGCEFLDSQKPDNLIGHYLVL